MMVYIAFIKRASVVVAATAMLMSTVFAGYYDDNDNGGRKFKQVHFVAKMDSSQIPEPDQTFNDRGKTGKAKFFFDKALGKLLFVIKTPGLDVGGILTPDDSQDNLTKIHFHKAPEGVAGPHVHNVYGAPCEPDLELSYLAKRATVTGVWDDGDIIREAVICPGLGAGPAGESLTDNIQALCDGLLYVNIHTAYAAPPNTPGDAGEIRGQILPTKAGKKICKALLRY